MPCGSRYCASCGLRWQGDQRVCAVAASEQLSAACALVTITAPGDAFFKDDDWAFVGGPWMRRRWWNEEARSEWRLFHLWASRPIRAWAQKHAPGWRLLFRSWEYQKRGLLHLHLVLPYGTPEERRCTDLYVFNLWSGARQHGFGYVMGGESAARPTWDRPPTVKPADGPSAARYVCKYVASTGAGKEGMVDVAQRTAQRGSVLYIAPSLTQAAGVNMTKLRSRRRIWSKYTWARESHDEWRAACFVDAMQRGRAPLTPEAVQRIRQAVRRTGACLWVDASTGELCPPTAAPPPRQVGRTSDVREPLRRRVVAVLAPVLLPDPDAPRLGRFRCEVAI